MSEYKHELQTTIPGDLGGRIVCGFLGVLVFALGLWIIKMGYDGRTLAEPIKPESVPGFLLFGVLFAWGGVQTIILSLGGNRLPRWVHAVLLSIFLICLGAPLIVIGVLEPESISGSSSLGGILLRKSQGGHANGAVFVGAGTILLALIPFVWRWLLAKKPER